MITDTIAPPRPKMPTMSRILFQSPAYVVCFTRAGLTVQRHSTGTGANMSPHHPQYNQWIHAWDDLVDTAEGVALCRYFMSLN
jgi:hypothetical protein